MKAQDSIASFHTKHKAYEIKILSSLSYLCYNKFFYLFIILKVNRHCWLLVSAKPDSSAPAIPPGSDHVHLITGERGHGDALNPMRGVDSTPENIIHSLKTCGEWFYSQHPTALGAYKAPDSHVDISWSPLFAVKALLVGLVLSLYLPDGQAKPVILLS